MHGYPMLDIFWTTLEFFIWVVWIFPAAGVDLSNVLRDDEFTTLKARILAPSA